MASVTVDSSEVDALLRRVQRELGRSPRKAAESVGSVMVEVLRAEPRPVMRIDTGRMRRSYRYRLRGRGGTRVEILNTARNPRTGQLYAGAVEARYRPVARTLAKHRRFVAKEAADDVRDGIRAAATTRTLSR